MHTDRPPGQALVEYALILVLAAVVVLLALQVAGVGLSDVYCGLLRAVDARPAGCSNPSDDPNPALDSNPGLEPDPGLDPGSGPAQEPDEEVVAQVLYSIGFDGGLSGWDIVAGKKWETGDGQLCVGPGGEHQAFTGDTNWSDYTIQLGSANLLNGNGYGVFFRAQGAAKTAGYSFQCDPAYGRPNGSFVIYKWASGQVLSPPISVSPAPAGYKWTDVERQVSVQVQGDTFTAYVDGEAVVQAQDSTYATGRIGLRTWDGTQACFDAIIVTTP